MVLIDFMFDGETLSDHKAAIGGISGASEQQSLGNKRSLSTVKIKDRSKLIASNYDEVYQLEFDIISNPCLDTLIFTDDEVYGIHNWLNNKGGYKKFIPLYDDDSFHSIYWMGTFTSVEAIRIGSNIVGFHLVFTADASYAYEDCIFKKPINSTHSNFKIYNTSQEIGYTYFDELKLTCVEDGDLIICNNKDLNNKVVVRNVVADEIITFDSIHEVITSSRGNDHEKLWNDFNYNWPRLVREKTETYNIISLDEEGIQSAIFEGKYKAIRKTGVIL